MGAIVRLFALPLKQQNTKGLFTCGMGQLLEMGVLQAKNPGRRPGFFCWLVRKSI
jgi:hypothetical protein